MTNSQQEGGYLGILLRLIVAAFLSIIIASIPLGIYFSFLERALFFFPLLWAPFIGLIIALPALFFIAWPYSNYLTKRRIIKPVYWVGGLTSIAALYTIPFYSSTFFILYILASGLITSVIMWLWMRRVIINLPLSDVKPSSPQNSVVGIVKYAVMGVIMVALIFGTIAYAVMFYANGTDPISLMIKSHMNKCVINKKSERTIVRFIGTSLSLPSSQVRRCKPIDMSTPRHMDPARIVIAGYLPNFYNEYQEDRYENEIRINFLGYNNAGRKTQGLEIIVPIGINNVKSQIESQRMERDKNEPAYDPLVKTDTGLLLYRTRSRMGTRARDIYIHENTSGYADFILECTSDKKHSPSMHKCISKHKMLSDKIFYTYEFDKKHLPQALQIDALVKDVASRSFNHTD